MRLSGGYITPALNGLRPSGENARVRCVQRRFRGVMDGREVVRSDGNFNIVRRSNISVESEWTNDERKTGTELARALLQYVEWKRSTVHWCEWGKSVFVHPSVGRDVNVPSLYGPDMFPQDSFTSRLSQPIG